MKEISNSALLALCEGNSPVSGEFSAQRASNAEKSSIVHCEWVENDRHWKELMKLVVGDHRFEHPFFTIYGAKIKLFLVNYPISL